MTPQGVIVVLMGVTGSGKSTIGHALSDQQHWPFAEGDDYHSEANRQKMHAGIPLTDEDRAPWIASLHAVLLGWHRAGSSGVLACSALKQSYRDRLAEDIPGTKLRFVLLEVPRPVLEQRLAQRKDHYMNPALLESQLATLEVPGDALRVDATDAPAAVVARILRGLDDSDPVH